MSDSLLLKRLGMVSTVRPWRTQFASLAVVITSSCFIAGGCARDEVDRPADDRPAPPSVSTERFDFDQAIQSAESLIAQQKWSEAESELRQVLLIDPTHADATFDLAAVEFANGKPESAIVLLDTIAPTHPRLGIPSRGRAADICIELKRFDEAVTRYQQLIRELPESSHIHRQLALILNRQGRRHEAAVHLRMLCRLGDIRQDELHALLILSDAVYDDPIGESGAARESFTKGKYVDAVALLEKIVSKKETPLSIHALYGRCLAEAQQDDKFLKWLSGVGDPVKEEAEYWGAVGSWLVNQQRFEEAIGALAQAIVRDSSDVRSYRRLHQSLTAIKRIDEAKKIDERHQVLRTVTLSSNTIGTQTTPDPKLLQEVIEGLKVLHRPLESLMWESIANYFHSESESELQRLNEQRVMLIDSKTEFPDPIDSLCGLRLDEFSVPDMDRLVESKTASPRLIQPAKTSSPLPRFANVAEQVGLAHTYYVSDEEQHSSYAIYQVLGGGVAVCDFDLDGNADLYFAQGGAVSPTFIGKKSDLLYRQVSGQTLDVTPKAGTAEYRYSTGVASGDWNQDGFPDLVIGNLGENLLLTNCGDGTFRSQTTEETGDPTRVTSSLGIADLTGDHLPDIYEEVYVHDDSINVRPKINQSGQLELVSPSDYRAGMDRVFVNDGTGGSVIKEIGSSGDDRSTGMGLVIARLTDGANSVETNQVYVGNDVRPNQLWVADGGGSWMDIAAVLGCSLGYDGTRTASMGIAAADFDRNGHLDLHITNFENASARLYMNRGDSFQDRAIALGLSEDSYPVLGFGTQALDYDQDGLEDLIVTNGHVENTNIPGSPYEQPPQLFINHGDHFKLTSVTDPSGYFQGNHVGRALATLDYDRDGRLDFVVTHLGTPSALILNQTDSENHWLQIQLVGVDCERDAIGSKIKLELENSTLTGWCIAGDGYLCSNESMISFGLGTQSRVNSLTVEWPGGARQVFSDIAADQRILIIQDEKTPFVMLGDTR